jgi:L-threonylcarbamoyladenylate synthase
MTSLSADERAQVESAARVLRAGGLVAFPTETVYGLGADAENARAVGRVFEAKGRPATHPLIVHLARADQLGAWAEDVPEAARLLAERFWPGPLTLVLRRSPRVPLAVTGGLETVALRVPAHPTALALLEAFGGGVAAPSANRFGSISPTTARDVREELGDRVDLVVDGGACHVGVESTIVDVTGAAPRILRPGGITREDLETALDHAVPTGAEGSPRAPGQHPSHYAPRARVLLAAPGDVVPESARQQALGRRVGVLLPAGHSAGAGQETISVPQSL